MTRAGWVKYEGMFYIGFRDEPHAQIGLARSKDGIADWQRHPANPIVRPGQNQWDHDACYKPFAIFDGRKWLLWYNGRHGPLEQIGLVTHGGEDLGFEPIGAWSPDRAPRPSEGLPPNSPGHGRETAPQQKEAGPRQTVSPPDLARGLVAHWPLDKDATDSLGRHHAATHGAKAAPSGILGGALAFDGKSSYVSLPAGATAGLRQWTFALWVKTRQAEGVPREQFWRNSTLLGMATGGPGSRDFGIILDSGNAGYHHGLGDGGVDTCLFSDTPINDDQWHLVSMTNSGTTIRLYVDGRAVGGEVVQHSGDLGDPAPGRQTSSGGELADVGVFLGACNDTTQPNHAAYFLHGLMDDVRLWNRALTAQEVAHLWTKTTGKPVPTAQSTRTALPAAASVEATIELKNSQGLRWALEKRGGRWTLGTLFVHDKPVDAPLTSGVLALRSIRGARMLWPAAAEGQQVDQRTARLSGSEKVGEATFRFEVVASLKEDVPLATLTPRWSVDKDLSGYEVCLAYHGTGGGWRGETEPPAIGATQDWRCTVYPFAGNAARVRRDRLTFVGVPAAIMFRQDLSLVTLFGIDPGFDYLNPTTWTGATGFHFDSGKVAPQYRVGAGKLAAGVGYSMPLQIFLSDVGNSPEAVTRLVRAWIKFNQYKVQPLRVRSHQEAFDVFLQGRRKSRMWRPGLGYQIMDLWKVIYTAESPINAYFDYLLYEQTGELMWRRRAFETMDLVLRAQHTDPKDPHCGVIETNYELETDPKRWTIPQPPFTGEKADPELKSGRFNSRDHSPNFGYKLDMNGYAARYMLMLWRRVKEKEGLDKREWREAAVRIADWIVRQQNPDGGLPQVVDYRRVGQISNLPCSMSVVSGRTLAAMPTIAEITGDRRYAKLSQDLEKFLRTHVEGRYWFTGAHVDLWPKDFEADSVWHAVEYWLDKYERTKDPECLKRAEADVWFAFLMWCPKQLPWVTNPTQTCHAEQENYLQYSNYCYNNRKYYCLNRLAKLTREPLFGELCERIIQCGFWGQATSGDWLGGQHERMSDPWKGVSGDVNSTGAVYVSELALDAHLQLLEMGLVRANKAENGH